MQRDLTRRSEYGTFSRVIDMKNKFKGTASLLLATVIWGSAFVAQSVGMDKLGPFTFQAVRCLLAVIVLSGIVLVKSPALFRNRSLWRAGFLCGAALFAASSLQQMGLQHTDAGKAGFLTAMYIVLVPVLGFFLGKKPPKTTLLSVILAVVGLYLLSCVGVTQINVGDLLLIGCAIAFTIQITLIDQLAPGLNGLALNCVQCLVCGLLSLPFLFLEGPSFGDITAAWLPLCYAGVLSLGVAYSLQIVGQKNLEPATASVLMSLESVFAALAGWLILQETMTGYEITGCVLLFAAVIISQFPVSNRHS